MSSPRSTQPPNIFTRRNPVQSRGQQNFTLPRAQDFANKDSPLLGATQIGLQRNLVPSTGMQRHALSSLSGIARLYLSHSSHRPPCARTYLVLACSSHHSSFPVFPDVGDHQISTLFSQIIFMDALYVGWALLRAVEERASAARAARQRAGAEEAKYARLLEQDLRNVRGGHGRAVDAEFARFLERAGGRRRWHSAGPEMRTLCGCLKRTGKSPRRPTIGPSSKMGSAPKSRPRRESAEGADAGSGSAANGRARLSPRWCSRAGRS